MQLDFYGWFSSGPGRNVRRFDTLRHVAEEHLPNHRSNHGGKLIDSITCGKGGFKYFKYKTCKGCLQSMRHLPNHKQDNGGAADFPAAPLDLDASPSIPRRSSWKGSVCVMATR